MKAIFLTVVNISTIKDIGLYPDLINELKQYHLFKLPVRNFQN